MYIAKRAPLGEIPVNRSRELAAKPPQDPGLKDSSSGAAYSDDDSGSDTDEEAWLDDVDLAKHTNTNTTLRNEVDIGG